jgi:hypothetical protein
MRTYARGLVIAALAAALSIPIPGRGQYDEDFESPVLVQERLSALRFGFGAAGVSRGVYCAYGYYTTSCSGLEYPYAPLLFSGEYEAGFSRSLGIALGVRYLTGPYLDRDVQVWEPTADLMLRFGSYAAGSSFRLRLGVGWWIGEGGNQGWGGRTGFGATFRGTGPFGLAFDVLWEYGEFEGNNASVIQGSIGPEFSF